MTEAEAKTKWCCGPKLIADQIFAMQRIHYERERGQPHDALPPNKNGTCVGSKCMAWRPMGARAFNKRTNKELSQAEPVMNGDDVEWREVEGGYCGLAGQP